MKTVPTFVCAAVALTAASAYALPPINGGDTSPFGKSGAAPAQPAAPAEPVKNPYVFDDWTIALNGKIAKPSSCVAFSDAKSKGKASGKRTEVRLTVTRTPGDPNEVFTILQGYNQPAGATGTLDVGGKTFKLLADKDALWSEKPEEDKQIIAALKSGGTVKVSAAGVEDTYSLAGFPGAYAAIGDKCK